MVYAPNSDHYLYALDTAGNLEWKFEGVGPNWTKPLADENMVYLASMDHNFYAFDKEFSHNDLVNAEDGSKTLLPNAKWSIDLGMAVVADPVFNDGVMYVVTIEGRLFAIDVESEKDKGTTFTVSIPLLEENEIENAGNRLKGEHTERRILYIDNNIHFSRTVSLALERLGYNVGMVTSLADMKSYMNSEERIDTVFMRCAFDEREKEKILQMITEKKNIFRIILITVPGISTYKQVLELRRDKITILNEPVTLKDILNSL